MIRSIIIDDELHCINSLTILLGKNCPQVEVTDTFSSPILALEAIKKSPPDLLFLDVEMPVMNGFRLLEQLPSIAFAIIFTTSYDQYAIRAIKFSALDFLLKPVDPDELVVAIRKVEQRHAPLAEQLAMLMNYVQNKSDLFKKIALPTAEGFELVPIDEVIRCEASDNYTHFYLSNHRKVVACRTLKDVEEQLQPFKTFIRVHHSSIVNLNKIVKYVRGEGGLLTMSDGSVVNVSRRKKEELMRWL